MAIILFLVEKTALTVICLVALMCALSVYPILHFAKSVGVRLTVVFVSVLGSILLGYFVWPRSHQSANSGDRVTNQTSHENARADGSIERSPAPVEPEPAKPRHKPKSGRSAQKGQNTPSASTSGDNSPAIGDITQGDGGALSVNQQGGITAHTVILGKDGSPINLSASFYDPQSPTIVISNLSDHVADGVVWSMFALRTSDLSYFGFVTQSVGYVKAQSKTNFYLLDLARIPKTSDGNGQIVDGDELTGSISIDCPQCEIRTYIVHFVLGHSRLFYESKLKNGYIVPHDMSKEGRAGYIQTLTSAEFTKDKIEIVSRPPL